MRNAKRRPSDSEITAFYSRHSAAVYRLCLSYLKNPEDAADAAQETFLKWLSALPELETPEHEIGWLVLTAGNLCKDMLRRSKRRPREQLEAAYDLGRDEKGFENAEVLEAVMALPGKYKNVVFLFYYEDMSTAQISRVTGIKQSTVTSLLVRARRLLKKALGDDDYE